MTSTKIPITIAINTIENNKYTIVIITLVNTVIENNNNNILIINATIDSTVLLLAIPFMPSKKPIKDAIGKTMIPLETDIKPPNKTNELSIKMKNINEAKGIIINVINPNISKNAEIIREAKLLRSFIF